MIKKEHPACSHSLLAERVTELLEKLDTDRDGAVSRQEYLTDPYRDLDTGDLQRRAAEFTELDKVSGTNIISDRLSIYQVLFGAAKDVGVITNLARAGTGWRISGN